MGAIYNQSQSHAAQPAVAASGPRYCCGTRGALNQLLFEDFLSGRRVPGSTGRPLRLHDQLSPELLGIDVKLFCLPLTAESQEVRSFLLLEEDVHGQPGETGAELLLNLWNY